MLFLRYSRSLKDFFLDKSNKEKTIMNKKLMTMLVVKPQTLPI